MESTPLGEVDQRASVPDKRSPPGRLRDERGHRFEYWLAVRHRPKGMVNPQDQYDLEVAARGLRGGLVAAITPIADAA